MSTENCIGHQIILTEDGSPSLKPLSDGSEWMHNKKGALSESLYIYGQAVIESYNKHQSELTIASVGLGLGYNELISLSLAFTEQIKLHKIYSFENLPELRDSFKNWINGIPSELDSTYDLILKLICEKQNISPNEFKKFISNALINKQLILMDDWPPKKFKDSFNCILFDAYSSKTSPELWSEEILEHCFTTLTKDKCLISTYAATGALKRSLKKSNFSIIERAGFAGKRQSTLALKG